MVFFTKFFHYPLKILLAIIIYQTKFPIKNNPSNTKGFNSIRNNSQSIKGFARSRKECRVTALINNGNTSYSINLSRNIPVIFPTDNFSIILIGQGNTKCWDKIWNRFINELVSSPSF